MALSVDPATGDATVAEHGGTVDDVSQEVGALDLEAVRSEVLEMNSYGMHLCQERSFIEALDCLEAAFLRVQTLGEAVQAASGDDAARLEANQQVVDQLKATTLNNMGVVECHRGDYSNSLDHLEAARHLEFRAGIQSPSTAVNLCAVYNATRDFERASTIAQEAIATLNASEEAMSDETKSLWGAAWHNLAIAELNQRKRGVSSAERNADVLCTFRNAMAATKDLLGATHPMTVAVHETFRQVRDQLKSDGAFKDRTPHTLPRIRANKTMPPPPDTEKPTQHALMGGTNNHGNGKYVAPPPVSRFATMGAYKKPESAAGTSRAAAANQRRQTDLFHPTAAMRKARGQYMSKHPLLAQKAGGSVSSKLPSLRGSQPAPPRTAGGSQTARRGGPHHGSGRGVGGVSDGTLERGATAPNPTIAPQPPATARQAPRRRLSELLLGDMWVEVQVPRNSPPAGANASGSAAVGAVASGSGAAAGPAGQLSPLRPAYGEALYVIDPSDAALEPVANPGAYAALDVAAPPAKPQPPSSSAPAAATDSPAAVPVPASSAQQDATAVAAGPASSGTAAAEDTAPLPRAASEHIADAFDADELSQYPALQTLVNARDHQQQHGQPMSAAAAAAAQPL